MASFGFGVYGKPSPQGSKIPGVNRKTGKQYVRDQSGEALKKWRRQVKEAAEIARLRPDDEGPTFGKEVPVAVNIVFFVERPKTVKRPYPSVKPDLDKYVRAVLDGMKDGEVYADDGQVVQIVTHKVYAGDSPGAWIQITDQLS